MKSQLLIIFSLSSALLFVAACGGGGKKSEREAIQVRNGESKSLVELSYYDGLPSISDNGQRIVFTSGRDGTRRSYKYDKANADQGPQRVTDADLGTEVFSRISPDGEWVVILAVDDAGFHAYVQKFSDAAIRAEITLPEGIALTNQASFSPGASPLLALAGIADDGSKILVVAFSEANSTLAINSVAPLTDQEAHESNPQWQKPSGAGYSLVTESKDSFGVNFTKRIFTDGQLAGLASSKIFTESLSGFSDSGYAVATDHFFYATQVPFGKKPVLPFGSKPEPEKSKVFIQNVPHLFTLSGNNDQVIENSLQYKVLAFSATHDGDAALLRGIEAYSCQFRDFSGSSLLLFQQNELTRLFFAYDGNAWSLISDPCGLYTEGLDPAARPIDTRVLNANLAAESQGAEYAVVYQTWYSDDEEVMLLTFAKNGGELSGVTFTNISNNSRPTTP